MEDRLRDRISLLTTQIGNIISKLDEQDKNKYEEELSNIRNVYEEELNNIIPHELTLRPEILVLQEYKNKIEELLNKVTICGKIKDIKDFCLNLDLTAENLREKLMYFEDVESEYDKLKKVCNSSDLEVISEIINRALYQFVYNEILFYDEDNILQSLTEEEIVYLTKILIENINKKNNFDLEEVINYYELKNTSILNKDVLNRLIELDMKQNNQKRKVTKLELNKPKEELNTKKDNTFVNKIRRVLKRKMTVDQFKKKTGVDPLRLSQSILRRMHDLSIIDFTGEELEMVDFSYSNVDIDPQKVKSKSLIGVNLEEVDMSGKNFEGVYLFDVNLTNTNAYINPQLIQKKSLSNCILRGLDLTHRDFSRVDLEHTDFRGANIYGSNFKDAIHLELAIFDEKQKRYLFEQYGIVLNNQIKNKRKSSDLRYNVNSKIYGTSKKNEEKLYGLKSDELIECYDDILLGNNRKHKR